MSDKAVGIVKRLAEIANDTAHFGLRSCPSWDEEVVKLERVLTEAGLVELIDAGRDVHYFMESQPTTRNFLPHESYELRQRVEKLTAALAKLEGAASDKR